MQHRYLCNNSGFVVVVLGFYVSLTAKVIRKRYNTLPPTPNWSPYIFMLLQNSCFYRLTKALPRLYKLFHSKMTCTFCKDDVRVMVPSFQKVTQFLQYKILHRDIIRLNFCLFEVIPDCHDLRKINFKSFASIGIFISST